MKISKNIKSFSYIIFSTFFLFSASSAQAYFVDEEGSVIYEYGVKLTKSANINTSSDNLLQSANEEVIAKVGDYNVIPGQMPENYIALKVPKNGLAYFIGKTIIVKCKKNQECVPQSLSPEKFGKFDKYKITVTNYTEYENAMTLLKEQKGVKFIKPTNFYGNKVNHR
jgi:hypothetical protein